MTNLQRQGSASDQREPSQSSIVFKPIEVPMRRLWHELCFEITHL